MNKDTHSIEHYLNEISRLRKQLSDTTFGLDLDISPAKKSDQIPNLQHPQVVVPTQPTLSPHPPPQPQPQQVQQTSCQPHPARPHPTHQHPQADTDQLLNRIHVLEDELRKRDSRLVDLESLLEYIRKEKEVQAQLMEEKIKHLTTTVQEQEESLQLLTSERQNTDTNKDGLITKLKRQNVALSMSHKRLSGRLRVLQTEREASGLNSARTSIEHILDAIKLKVVTLDKRLSTAILNIGCWTDKEHVFKKAFAEIKRVVIEITGSSDAAPAGLQWTLSADDPVDLQHHQRNCLLKNMQDMVITWDNMGTSRYNMTTIMEELAANGALLMRLAREAASSRDRDITLQNTVNGLRTTNGNPQFSSSISSPIKSCAPTSPCSADLEISHDSSIDKMEGPATQQRRKSKSSLSGQSSASTAGTQQRRRSKSGSTLSSTGATCGAVSNGYASGSSSNTTNPQTTATRSRRDPPLSQRLLHHSLRSPASPSLNWKQSSSGGGVSQKSSSTSQSTASSGLPSRTSSPHLNRIRSHSPQPSSASSVNYRTTTTPPPRPTLGCTTTTTIAVTARSNSPTGMSHHHQHHQPHQHQQHQQHQQPQHPGRKSSSGGGGASKRSTSPALGKPRRVQSPTIQIFHRDRDQQKEHITIPPPEELPVLPEAKRYMQERVEGLMLSNGHPSATTMDIEEQLEEYAQAHQQGQQDNTNYDDCDAHDNNYSHNHTTNTNGHTHNHNPVDHTAPTHNPLNHDAPTHNPPNHTNDHTHNHTANVNGHPQNHNPSNHTTNTNDHAHNHTNNTNSHNPPSHNTTHAQNQTTNTRAHNHNPPNHNTSHHNTPNHNNTHAHNQTTNSHPHNHNPPHHNTHNHTTPNHNTPNHTTTNTHHHNPPNHNTPHNTHNHNTPHPNPNTNHNPLNHNPPNHNTHNHNPLNHNPNNHNPPNHNTNTHNTNNHNNHNHHDTNGYAVNSNHSETAHPHVHENDDRTPKASCFMQTTMNSYSSNTSIQYQQQYHQNISLNSTVPPPPLEESLQMLAETIGADTMQKRGEVRSHQHLDVSQIDQPPPPPSPPPSNTMVEPGTPQDTPTVTSMNEDPAPTASPPPTPTPMPSHMHNSSNVSSISNFDGTGLLSNGEQISAVLPTGNHMGIAGDESSSSHELMLEA